MNFNPPFNTNGNLPPLTADGFGQIGFAQFPNVDVFQTKTTKDIGNEFYKNQPIQKSDGLVVYADPETEALFLKSSHLKELIVYSCLLYTSPSPRDRQKSRMPSSA